MPNLKSSSKGTTTLTLFASERRALCGSVRTCHWINENSSDGAVGAAAEAAAEAIAKLLKLIPAPGTTPKEAAKQPA